MFGKSSGVFRNAWLYLVRLQLFIGIQVRPYGVPSVSKVQKVHALFYKSACTFTNSACTFTIVRALFVKVNCKSARTFELLKLMARYISDNGGS